MVTADELRRIALSFPGAMMEDGTGFEVNGKGFAWSYKEKMAGQKGRTEHLDVLAVRVANEGEKQALIAADPSKFFTDAHYNGYPAVLVRLAAIEADELIEWCGKKRADGKRGAWGTTLCEINKLSPPAELKGWRVLKGDLVVWMLTFGVLRRRGGRGHIRRGRMTAGYGKHESESSGQQDDRTKADEHGLPPLFGEWKTSGDAPPGEKRGGAAPVIKRGAI